MTRKEIEALNNEIITEEQMEEIESHEEVETVENLGTSASKIGCVWYSVEFKDGQSTDVFMK